MIVADMRPSAGLAFIMVAHNGANMTRVDVRSDGGVGWPAARVKLRRDGLRRLVCSSSLNRFLTRLSSQVWCLKTITSPWCSLDGMRFSVQSWAWREAMPYPLGCGGACTLCSPRSWLTCCRLPLLRLCALLLGLLIMAMAGCPTAWWSIATRSCYEVRPFSL